jgi:FkbM family methyltransferase
MRAGQWLRRALPANGEPALAARVDQLAAELRDLRHELQETQTYAEPFHFRSGTLDRAIYREVVVENEYRLPERFETDDLILDIGCHIGSFAHACLIRGAGRVVSFEAEQANFAVATQNLRRHGARADVRRMAVWRSDQPVEWLSFSASDDPTNTGGGAVGADGSQRVPAVAFDRVLAELTAHGQRIRILKLDCEGSEYPILLTAPSLAAIDAVLGEYHAMPAAPPSMRVNGQSAYGANDLKAALERHGFAVALQPNPRNPLVGEFFATRRS